MSWNRISDPRLAAGVSDLAAAAQAADGVAPLSGHLLETLAGGEPECLFSTDGQLLLGVAVALGNDPVELFVGPQHRGVGLGAALVTAALDRSGAVWAHGDLPAARALATRFGLRKIRELLQMRRPLTREWAAEQVRIAPLPAGVRLRTFVPGQDDEQFLGVNARAFDWHPEQGRLDLAGLRGEMSQPWFDPAGFILAVDTSDTVLGFHWTKVHTDPLTEPLGEVYVLGVDPLAVVAGAPVRGLGGPLTAAGLSHLAGRGLRTVVLYVEGDNVKALRLYRRLGFEVARTDVVYRRAE